MSGAHLHAKRGIERRLLLLGFVAALIVAPVLANVWPAFGKGPMLCVAATEAHVAVDADAAHAGYAPPGHESHHQVHCALCALACLGWAPPLALGLSSLGAGAIDHAVTVIAQGPRAQAAWPGARARAPPLS
ncbi:MAG TPA: DUF2946 family protein [Burkholderiaceae bacterium]|nr:DUF2946 family protein [Burkholderiaceae bacterium]